MDFYYLLTSLEIKRTYVTQDEDRLELWVLLKLQTFNTIYLCLYVLVFIEMKTKTIKFGKNA
jgi:hypothetical protein